MRRHIRGCAGLLAVAVILQGCSATSDFQRRYADRWGPDPSIPDSDVKTVLERQTGVMREIVTLSQVPVNPGRNILWYQVARFGMNYVDEKCDVYMNDLFILNRERDRNDSLLKSASTTTNNIVGATLSAASAKIPLLAIANAFGLLLSVNDAATKTYLFEQQIPGIVADKVTTARLLYRQRLDDNQRSGAALVDDEAAAYQVIRSYLNLCLPQTIEGEFLKSYIAGTPVVVNPTAPPVAAAASGSRFSAVVGRRRAAPSRFFTITQSPPAR